MGHCRCFSILGGARGGVKRPFWPLLRELAANSLPLPSKGHLDAVAASRHVYDGCRPEANAFAWPSRPALMCHRVGGPQGGISSGEAITPARAWATYEHGANRAKRGARPTSGEPLRVATVAPSPYRRNFGVLAVAKTRMVPRHSGQGRLWAIEAAGQSENSGGVTNAN